MRRRALRELGLDGHVELLGVVPHKEIRTYCERATIFVLPCCQGADGSMDGIPVALMEAMAMELPVVSTAISGVPELIEHGVSGLLVPPGDSVSLAQAMGVLLRDEALRLRLSRNAREKVLSSFDLEKNVTQLAQMLSAALDAACPRGTTPGVEKMVAQRS